MGCKLARVYKGSDEIDNQPGAYFGGQAVDVQILANFKQTNTSDGSFADRAADEIGDVIKSER